MDSEIKTAAGKITLSGLESTPWQGELTSYTQEDGLEFVTVKLSAPQPSAPPRFKLMWLFPQTGITMRLTPSAHVEKHIPPNYRGKVISDLASFAPEISLLTEDGTNKLTFAFSDGLRYTELCAGVQELTLLMECSVTSFTRAEAPIDSYQATLRLDTRPVQGIDAIRETAEWFASFPGYAPCPVPEQALRPLYSTWYSYHQDLFHDKLEQECTLAKQLGMDTIIVDDGWQTDDNKCGYAFCGDWEIVKSRFPDFKAHVDKVHALGMKYLFWFSVPFVGFKSKSFKRFQGKYLYSNEAFEAAILDPRFPDVREYLINIYEKAVKEWELDGLKLDFIDIFVLTEQQIDPAIAENYAGRDFKSIAQAVDTMLTDIVTRLQAVKKDIMIEFRQPYIGPAIRKYGNMFRATDCPCDFHYNRIRTLDLRMTSGNTAVHSDMIIWRNDETVENAARQFLNILFSVPQISVRLAELPRRHADMLRFWLAFWNEHRDTLLSGKLQPMLPQMNYPIVRAADDRCSITAVYAPGIVVQLAPGSRKECCIVNAGTASVVPIDADISAPATAECFNADGSSAGTAIINPGLANVPVPESGLLVVRF